MHCSLFCWGRRALPILVALVLAACGGGGSEQPAPRTVAAIELNLSAALFTGPGQEKQITALALDEDGRPMEAGTVVWTSSAPDQVAVDASGKLRSVSEIGSAAIVAEVNGIRSAPVFVATVALKPGTLMVRDADVIRIDAPISVPVGGSTLPGVVYDVWLSSALPAPAPGAVVLAAETAVLGGKVIETERQPNQLRVRLQTASAPDLLARYDVDWAIDLRNYELVEGNATGNGRARPQRARKRPLAEEQLAEWKLPKTGGPSPLSCEGALAAKLETKPVEVKFSGSPTLQVISSRLDNTLPPGRLRIAMVGDLVLETTVGLVAKAELEGTVKCELKGKIPVPVLPWPIGPFLRLQVPIGIGASVKASMDVASIDIGYSGKNGASIEVGIDCGPGAAPCKPLQKAEMINEFTPHLELHSLSEDGPKVTLDAQVYLLSGLDVRAWIPLVVEEDIELVTLTAGPKQSSEFASVKRQAGSPLEASKYDLKFEVEVGPGSTVKKLIGSMMGESGDVGLSFSAGFKVPISESPNGSWAPDKTQLIPGRDRAVFDITLVPASTSYFLLGYNVESIEIYHRPEGAPFFSHVGSVPAGAGSKFQWVWTPTTADAGRNEFAAFVKTRLPVVELEIAPNSIRTVNVGCVGATPAGTGRAKALAAGVCEDKWVGRATGRTEGVQAFTAELTWVQDRILPPNQTLLRARGVVHVDQLVYINLGCTVTPSDFNSFADTSTLVIDRAVTPAAYTFSVLIESDLTIACGDDPPFTIPLAHPVAFDGGGTLTGNGTLIEGSFTTPQGGYSYRFELVPPDSPEASPMGSTRAR